jgi:hypothetical protein
MEVINWAWFFGIMMVVLIGIPAAIVLVRSVSARREAEEHRHATGHHEEDPTLMGSEYLPETREKHRRTG